MNIGHSSRLPYDEDYYPDKLAESTYSINYRINSDQIYNEKRCRSKFGPRSGYMGHGVSVPNDLGYAEAQSLVDLDSVFSNRNVKKSKAKRGKVNPENPVETYKLYHSKTCENTLDPIYSLDSHPRSNYRDMEINRFENLPRNPQDHIFEDWARNSRLEAIDNFVPEMPVPWPDLAGPKPTPEKQLEPCYYDCETKSKRCPSGWRKQ
jgi:hypothetical protein